MHPSSTKPLLEGCRVAFFGKLAGMSRREASTLLAEQGGICVDSPQDSPHLIVLGEAALALGDNSDLTDALEAATRHAAQRGELEVLSETEFWQRLGLLEACQGVQQLFTPAQLAGLLHVPVSVIRRWQRRGLIRAVQTVHKLAYFDFREVTTARRLAELLASGVSPQKIEKQLAALARWLPEIERPLAQLSVITEGRHLLLRQGEGLIDHHGQRRMDFQAAEPSGVAIAAVLVPDLPATIGLDRSDNLIGGSAGELLTLAAELDDAGQLAQAADVYRAALAAAGPTAEVCFQLAELLYRLNELPAATERYYMAIELDEDYVEARANLGCLLAETGRLDLAVAAFTGALKYHPDYADVHYHLAETLDRLGRGEEAQVHRQTYQCLCPDSPWR